MAKLDPQSATHPPSPSPSPSETTASSIPENEHDHQSLANDINNEDDIASNASPPPSPSPSPSEQKRKRKRASTLSVTTKPAPKKPRRQSRRGVRERYVELLNGVLWEAGNPYLDGVTTTTTAPTIAPYTTFTTSLSPSQIGITHWSPASKSTLFRALGLHTRHDLPRLALACGKSIPEVSIYLQLLQRGAREQQVRGRVDREKHRSGSGCGFAEMEAAVEMDVEVERVLEEMADGVEEMVGGWEDEREKALWGECWVVDEGVAGRLEEEVRGRIGVKKRGKSGRKARRRQGEDEDDDEDEETESDSDSPNDTIAETSNTIQHTVLHHTNALRPTQPHLVTASTLLSPLTLLQLSHRLFMNPGPPNSTHNWFYLSSPPGTLTPSIRATAIYDLFNLIVELTRRLVSTAIFQAMGRLRASGGRRAHVRAGDVRAAVEALGVGGRGFGQGFSGGAGKGRGGVGFWEGVGGGVWEGVARRNNLKVFDVKVRADRLATLAWRKGLGKPMGYDEVEKRLREGSQGSASAASPSPTRDLLDSGADVGANGRLSDFTDSEDGVAEDAASDVSVSHTRSPSPTSTSSTDTETGLATTLDAHATALETARLWQLLRMDPPHTNTSAIDPVVAEDEGGQDEKEKVKRKSKKQKREVVEKDWREGVDWRGEWERYGYSLPESAFSLRGQKKKRVASGVTRAEHIGDAGSSGTDADEVGDDDDDAEDADSNDADATAAQAMKRTQHHRTSRPAEGALALPPALDPDAIEAGERVESESGNEDEDEEEEDEDEEEEDEEEEEDGEDEDGGDRGEGGDGEEGEDEDEDEDEGEDEEEDDGEEENEESEDDGGGVVGPTDVALEEDEEGSSDVYVEGDDGGVSE